MTFKLEGEVEDNREKWRDFCEKLMEINQHCFSTPLKIPCPNLENKFIKLPDLICFAFF
jgi:hypothetical protein